MFHPVITPSCILAFLRNRSAHIKAIIVTINLKGDITYCTFENDTHLTRILTMRYINMQMNFHRKLPIPQNVKK